MRHLVSWILIGTLTAMGCASSGPPLMETDTETTNPERLPEVLSFFQPGQRIEVWTMDGESFEAEFVSFDSQTLSVRDKTYRKAYQRDIQNHRDQIQYGLTEIARVRAIPSPRKMSSEQSKSSRVSRWLG